MNAKIEDNLVDFVRKNLLFGELSQSLDTESSFLDSGIIDSTGILELVSFLEIKYGIRISDEEVVPENLDSVSRIATFVRSKMSVGQS